MGREYTIGGKVIAERDLGPEDALAKAGVPHHRPKPTHWDNGRPMYGQRHALADVGFATYLEAEFECWLSWHPPVPNPNPVWRAVMRRRFVSAWFLNRHHCPVPF